jgi:hypothetical protein
VRRIHYNRRGSRNLLHHLAPDKIALQAAYPAFNLCVTFAFFKFFANLMFAHAELFAELPHLPDQVDSAEDYKQAYCFPQQAGNRVSNSRHGPFHMHQGQA